MDTIVFLKYIGFFYVFFGLSCLLNKKIHEILITLVKDDSQLWLMGMMTLIFSLPIVLFHNNNGNFYLALFVTFVGWAGLLKTFFIWSFPGYVKSKVGTRFNLKNLKIRSVIALVVGLLSFYFAYI